MKRAIALIALVAPALLLTGCELASEPPAEAKPEAPKARRLYAPPAPDAGLAPQPTALPEPDEEETDGELRAALTGGRRAAPPAETEEIPRAERRRRRRATSTPLEEEEAASGPAGLSDGAFQSAVTDWSGMKRCLASAAGRLPTQSGALRVRFTIRGDGRVVRSEVVDTTNEVAEAIAPCVERRARQIRFPSFAAAGDEIEKTAKFVF